MREQFQQTVLSMIARGDSVADTAAHICREAETFAGGVLCSMVTVDPNGLLHPLAGPSLPADYSACLDGIAIGPNVGSCGSAAFLREAVTVSDIFVDHRWAPYKTLVEPLGVRACWSSPITRRDGHVVGAFGFYYEESRGPTSEEEHLVAECLDLSAFMLDREEMRAEIYRLANCDALTGLGNRAHFERTLAKASHSGQEMGLLLADIDRLKDVNASFGYAAGDLLLSEVARRMAQIAWPYDAFRIGDSQFAILFTGHETTARMPRVANRLLGAMREPVRCGQYVISPTLTCGSATFHPLLLRDPAQLRRRADTALRHAKETARGAFVPFNERMARASTHRMQVVRSVTHALVEDRVEAYYQPIIRLDTRELAGLEALCRVRTPQGEIVPAAQFAESMQDPSIATLITDRMLAVVARDIRDWLDKGLHVGRVGVNVSMADFQKGDLRKRLLNALSAHDVSPSHVTLELTESVYLGEDEHNIIGTIEQLRTDGFLLALDDFGTGYASLTHLLNFPVDVIKIDKSLVDRMSPGDGGEVIMKALLEMAQGLDLRIVAEGVETNEQATHLERLGCKFVQGYLFGRPSDFAATTKRLMRADLDISLLYH